MVLYESKAEITGLKHHLDYNNDPETYWSVKEGNTYTLVGTIWDLGIIRFTTPAFVDGAKYVRLTLTVYRCSEFSLGCAICKSDSNWEKYRFEEDWTNNVVDKNQIARCDLMLSQHLPQMGTGFKKITHDIPVESLEPNKTYYLFLWRNEEYTESNQLLSLEVGPNNSHSVSVFCQVGLINIDTGSSLETYQCYIDNGTSWDMVVPYIDNGSGWDMYT